VADGINECPLPWPPPISDRGGEGTQIAQGQAICGDLGARLEAVVEGPSPGRADSDAKVRQNTGLGVSVLQPGDAALAAGLPACPASFLLLSLRWRLLMATKFDHGSVAQPPCPAWSAADALARRGRFLVLEASLGLWQVEPS